MNLRLFNSLTQKKEVFKPINSKQVSLYVCGITPYDTTHLGHAFTYISFDILVRILMSSGIDVLYTQNVTDINDRDNDILKKAKEQNVPWDKLGVFWTQKFLSDMEALNWTVPTNYLKASEQIPSMIELIQKIIASGIGYEANGSVYLDIEKDKDFGKISRFSKEKMLQVAKEFEEDLGNPEKKHPLDITLWKASDENQPSHIPSFSSPFGLGRPGWHIECSAMAITSLGDQLDIHGGGIDLLYPHHESEVAQSEAATGKKPFAKFWMHTGTVHIHGLKMSKSLGNLILINDLLKKYSPNAIRWVLLSHHYRESWNYDEDEFQQAEKSLEWIKIRCNAYPSSLKNEKFNENSSRFARTIIEALENDLDTPNALLLLTESLEHSPTVQLQNDIKDILLLLGFTNLGN